MKNLILLSIIFLLLIGCKKEEKDEPYVFTLKGKWLSWEDGANSEIAIKSSELIEFGDNTYESVFNEKMVTLPDCTLIYKFKRFVTLDYSVHNHFIRFSNMMSDTNGVAEYTGKTMYMMHFFGNNELILTEAEMWHQLSGTNGQLKDGLFYQLDSSYGYQQDTIKYHHYKIEFYGDFVDSHYLTNGSREMPDENADWDLKCYQAEFTDSTFVLGYKAYYQFIDGLMISHGRRGQMEIQKSYMSYAYYLSLIGGK